MEIPNWYETLLLAAAAYRFWRLLAEDDILDRPRRLLLRLGEAWEKEGDPVPPDYRGSWAEFLICPWCAGFWTAIAWWGAWQIWPHAAIVVAVPFAISALVGLIARVLPSD
jgi:hypothetical protein